VAGDRRNQKNAVKWLLDSGLFDYDFYRSHYGVAFPSEQEAARHYVDQGSGLGWKPNLLFDPLYYLRRIDDPAVPLAGALGHFVEGGDVAGHQPSLLFDNRWYREAYAVPAETNTLAHYLGNRHGGCCSPTAEFDAGFYLKQNPDVKAAGIDPFVHFLLTGYREGRNPSPLFDVSYYCQTHLHTAAETADVNPLLHYLEHRDSTPLARGPWEAEQPRPAAAERPINAAVAVPQRDKAAKARTVKRGEEFLLAGHSNYFAMGAPGNYRGPRGLVAGEAHGRSGFYVMEENSADRTQAYWDLVAASSNNRDVVLSWNGNQHVVHFLFEPVPYFDFIESSVPQGAALREGAVILPRRLIKGFFQHTFDPLAALLVKIRANGPKSITLVGTPPPRGDLAIFEKMIRPAPFWRQVAANCGLDLDTAQLVQPVMLLKLWGVLQEMLKESAEQAGGRFVPVPDSLRDSSGFLPGMYGIDIDFTHANNAYGSQMMKAALS
jgi:hypothetical protein